MQSNNKTWEYVGAWSGLAYLMLFGLGWLILAQFFPPISPAASPEQVAHIFVERRIPLMLACVAMMLSTILLFPCLALMILIAQKIEQRVGMLTVMMALTSVTYLVMNFYVPLFWSAAAFRADRAPEIIQLMSDLGYLQFMGGIPMFFMIWVFCAYGALVLCPRENPIIPRWFGYLSLWTAILYIPELLIYFFKVGPFAWDGIIGFWIPAILFIVFFLATPFVLVPAVKRHF